MATTASRATAQGPRGFSLASILTPSWKNSCRAARASMGSVTTRSASAAEAAADRLRKERRDGEETIRSSTMTHLTGVILSQNVPQKDVLRLSPQGIVWGGHSC